MDLIFQTIPPNYVALAMLMAVVGGLVKGVVGFAMPTVLISGLGLFLSPELALAGLILPTVVTNGWQALRQGVAAAWASMRRFRVFLLTGVLCLLASAQLVPILPSDTMMLILGIVITGFAALQLAGFTFSFKAPSARLEVIFGGIAGTIGGMSGVWGPPTVAYLTAINTEKTEHMRVQGVIYGLGAVALIFAHVGSGVLNVQTASFSALLIPPALLGIWLGSKVHDRIDQKLFRRAILAVLLIAGLNLIRRGLML